MKGACHIKRVRSGTSATLSKAHAPLTGASSQTPGPVWERWLLCSNTWSSSYREHTVWSQQRGLSPSEWCLSPTQKRNPLGADACTQCTMPQPSREGRFGGPRASQGGDTICHQTPQACRPPTSLPAILAACWLPLHLFGQQTPQEAFLLHSLQSPPLALQTRVYVAQKAPGTINSPSSRGWLCLRPGGFLTSTTCPAMGAAGGSGVPQTPFQHCLCLLGAVFAQARNWSSLHPRFPDHKIAKMGNVLICNKYQFLYCYLTQTIR